MAPTGRAARRMVESTGCENASTMHLALGLLGDDTDFEPDFEYLSAGFLNVDEVSMVDMHLAYEFFRRVSRRLTFGVRTRTTGNLLEMGSREYFIGPTGKREQIVKDLDTLMKEVKKYARFDKVLVQTINGEPVKR